MKSRGKNKVKVKPTIRTFVSSSANTKQLTDYSTSPGSPGSPSTLKKTERAYLADRNSPAKRQRVGDAGSRALVNEDVAVTDDSGPLGGKPEPPKRSQVSIFL